MENTPNFQNLSELLNEHIKNAVAEMVKHQVEIALKNSTTLTKEFYNQKEVEYITGITICGLKNRRKRGTMKMVYDGTMPLVSKFEVDRLIAKLKKAS